jgi:hypothetical protein
MGRCARRFSWQAKPGRPPFHAGQNHLALQQVDDKVLLASQDQHKLWIDVLDLTGPIQIEGLQVSGFHPADTMWAIEVGINTVPTYLYG